MKNNYTGPLHRKLDCNNAEQKDVNADRAAAESGATTTTTTTAKNADRTFVFVDPFCP